MPAATGQVADGQSDQQAAQSEPRQWPPQRRAVEPDMRLTAKMVLKRSTGIPSE